MERSGGCKSYLALTVLLAVFVVLISQQSDSAAMHNKRSISSRPHRQDPGPCRTGYVCGWEVYDSFTRNLEYYVSASCKCATGETCIRMEDDVSIAAYVYRCRVRRRRTTARPTNGTTTATTTSS